MNRAERRRQSNKPASRVTRGQIVQLTNELNVAVTIRTLNTVFGFGQKRLALFLESYVALMAEVADNRITVRQAVDDAVKLTGVDIREALR